MSLMTMFTIINKTEERDLAAEIRQELEELAAMRAEIAPALAAINEAEKRIKELVLEHGEGVTHAGIKTSVRNGYERKSWNTAGLEGLAEVYPEIMSQQKISQIKASATISR